MSREAALNAGAASSLTERIPASWRKPLAHLAFLWGALLLLTAADWVTMAGKWWEVSTYNHVLFVPVILAWLIWVRRSALAQLIPTAWWPGFIALFAALLIWLLGTISGVNSASQLGAVGVLQASVLLVLGPRVTAALLFPLGFMIFLVPFGDEIVPALQMITAHLVIVLTHWSGIPAVIDGVFIDTPAGLFEVAQACSGVKFLVAMIALGVLVAQTCFLTVRRRVLFLAAAVLLPILANGVRAWGTIYIAQFRGLDFARGFDHIFYGWIFFALVVAALLGGAWRWFDRAPDDCGPDIAKIMASPFLARLTSLCIPGMIAALAGMAMVLAFALWSSAADRIAAQVPAAISLPAVAGWRLVDYTPKVPWQPRAQGAKHKLLGRYRTADGQVVDVFYALYSAQGEGREASAFGEGALTPDTPWRWLEPGNSTPAAHSEYLLAHGFDRRLAETTYRTGALTTGSAVRLKLATMRARLLLKAEPTMLLILSVEQPEKADPRVANAAIAQFRHAIGSQGQWMDHIAGLR